MNTTPSVNNPLTPLACFREALVLIGHPSLRRFIIIPILINLLLYSLAFGLGYLSITALIEQVIPAWLDWLRWLLWPLFFISYIIVVFFTFTLLSNLLAAPFYGKLSEQTLGIVSGNPVIIHDLPLASVLWSELTRLFYIGSRSIPLLILSVIPGINLLAPLLWGLFGAWGMALEFMVYPMENEGLTFKQQKQRLKTTRLGSLSFGGLTLLGLAIPLLNILVPPVAVISATVYWHRLQMRGEGI